MIYLIIRIYDKINNTLFHPQQLHTVKMLGKQHCL
jgi:hypothetical protein